MTSFNLNYFLNGLNFHSQSHGQLSLYHINFGKAQTFSSQQIENKVQRVDAINLASGECLSLVMRMYNVVPRRQTYNIASSPDDLPIIFLTHTRYMHPLPLSLFFLPLSLQKQCQVSANHKIRRLLSMTGLVALYYYVLIQEVSIKYHLEKTYNLKGKVSYKFSWFSVKI